MSAPAANAFSDAGDHDRADRLVAVESEQLLPEFVHQRVAERVQSLRTVEPDQSHPAMRLDEDRLVANSHLRSPGFPCACCVSYALQCAGNRTCCGRAWVMRLIPPQAGAPRAALAGLALAPIDLPGMLEIAELAVRLHVIAQAEPPAAIALGRVALIAGTSRAARAPGTVAPRAGARCARGTSASHT